MAEKEDVTDVTLFYPAASDLSKLQTDLKTAGATLSKQETGASGKLVGASVVVGLAQTARQTGATATETMATGVGVWATSTQAFGTLYIETRDHVTATMIGKTFQTATEGAAQVNG
ncbi:hypothetical protein OG474_20385 [Kribbella sp. NBC_01505]|uniref:hypothetical protein n=1 Tax=Kribbella sp. NBC_01505 TaxID=2903580 RepID=UPI003870C74C